MTDILVLIFTIWLMLAGLSFFGEQDRNADKLDEILKTLKEKK